jgi:hypothetical protein
MDRQRREVKKKERQRRFQALQRKHQQRAVRPLPQAVSKAPAPALPAPPPADGTCEIEFGGSWATTARDYAERHGLPFTQDTFEGDPVTRVTVRTPAEGQALMRRVWAEYQATNPRRVRQVG